MKLSSRSLLCTIRGDYSSKMKRHKCTLCRRKRRETFLRPVRSSDKPGSRTWICEGQCFDGRIQGSVLSFLQDRKADVAMATRADSRVPKANGSTIKAHGYQRQSLLQNGQSYGSQGTSLVPGKKLILDACCGNRMFWFNKKHPSVIYSDLRADVDPDIVQDFQKLPYPDKSFKLVVFDPPHLFDKSRWINQKYGVLLRKEWPMQLQQGFNECMRVLEDQGILIFKWSQGSISVSTVLSVIGVEPLFGHNSDKKSHTHWMCFMKI